MQFNTYDIGEYCATIRHWPTEIRTSNGAIPEQKPGQAAGTLNSRNARGQKIRYNCLYYDKNP